MNKCLASLVEYAVAIVSEPIPDQKVQLARELEKVRNPRTIPVVTADFNAEIPDQPGRPVKPELLSARQMPRRRVGSKKGLVALVHALAHIELNAIDMAFDLIARFHSKPLPPEFIEGAVNVALDEARHFEMINVCLEQLGASYGDLPAHGGLWDATLNTSHDLLARLAIVPLVLEARGLDVSPRMIKQVRTSGSETIARTMETIYNDEISHVAFGVRWFEYLCHQQNVDPKQQFQLLVKTFFRGQLKPPFNEKARSQAGLTPDFYGSLTKN